jgi:hypothetical protein
MEQEVSRVVEKFVEQLVAGSVDRATARCDLMFALREKGFWDLSCDEDWLNSVLQLNFSLRCAWRDYMFSQRTLNAAPAQELYRAFDRKNPRDWARRWTEVGGQLYDSRMIALKNDRIWLALSDFGFPFPPFALGSGMRVRSVDRRTAMNLGLIDLFRQIASREVPRPELILPRPTPEEA